MLWLFPPVYHDLILLILILSHSGRAEWWGCRWRQQGLTGGELL